MSKKSARKARERQQPAGVGRTPTTGNAGAKVAGRGDDFSPVQQPQISEAAKGPAAEEAAVQASEVAKLEPLSREEEIGELPTFRDVTGVKGSVENFRDILLWALKSTCAKDAVFDEVTPAEKVDERTVVLWSIIKVAIEKGDDGVDVESAIPQGRSALVPNRSRNFKLGFDGTWTLGVAANYCDHVASVLKPILGLLVAPDEIEAFDFECPIKRCLFTAGVLEQLLVQFEVYAAPRFDWAYRSSTVYSFAVSSAAHKARIEKAGGITLGKVGFFPFKPANNRTTYEEMYVLGTTGVGSAREDLRPAVAGAIACSTNKVKTLEETQGVRNSFKVIKLVYPYSRARYDQVTSLFTQGRFRLVNPRVKGAKPLEIFVAPTLLELSQVAGVQLVKAVDHLEGEGEGEDEEPKAIDLSPPVSPPSPAPGARR